jgi:hypothetical protein
VTPKALPRAGATGVSTATSLIVLAQTQPTELTLIANGQAVPLADAVQLGSGVDTPVAPARGSAFGVTGAGPEQARAGVASIATVPATANPTASPIALRFVTATILLLAGMAV